MIVVPTPPAPLSKSPAVNGNWSAPPAIAPVKPVGALRASAANTLPAFSVAAENVATLPTVNALAANSTTAIPAVTPTPDERRRLKRGGLPGRGATSIA